jgi:putative CocE/NonD family hydrolase
VKVPVHTSGGWFDIFVNGTINGFTGMRKNGGTEKARRESKMLIGAWGHGPSQKFGTSISGQPANRDLFERELRWYDHYLKGEDNGVDREPPVEIFYMGVNKWKHADDWPVPGTKFTPYYLSSSGKANSATGDGALVVTQPSGSGTDKYQYDPNNPVPTVGGTIAAERLLLLGRRTNGRSSRAPTCSCIRARPCRVRWPSRVR